MPNRIFLWLMLIAEVLFVPEATLARWYDPRAGQFTSVDEVFDFPENFGSAYAYAARNPVNNIDPLGTNVYVVRRQLGVPIPLITQWLGWKISRHVGEHIYLAFTDTNMREPWRHFVQSQTSYGFRKLPPGRRPSPQSEDLKEYAEWITFSYHPRGVDNGVGNRMGTLYTDGWTIKMNDVDADVMPLGSEPFSSTLRNNKYDGPKATMCLVTQNENDQIAMFNSCMYYWVHRGDGQNLPEDDVLPGYALTNFNCGSWAQLVVENQGLKWPSHLINHGTATAGPMDYTVLPQATYVGSAAAWQITHFLKQDLFLPVSEFISPF